MKAQPFITDADPEKLAPLVAALKSDNPTVVSTLRRLLVAVKMTEHDLTEAVKREHVSGEMRMQALFRETAQKRITQTTRQKQIAYSISGEDYARKLPDKPDLNDLYELGYDPAFVLPSDVR